MSDLYKATRPDGTDVRTGSIDYAAALASGAVLRHPTSTRMVPNDASTYLSLSTAPTDCTGFSWPCRLFRCEPEGDVLGGMNYPNKRAVLALRVIEELPAWQVFGPQGQDVAWVIERARTLTADEGNRLATAWAAARDATWAATWVAARDAAWAAARDAAWAATRAAARAAARDAAWAATWAATRDAARDAAWAATWAATRDAARAYLVRDLITPEQFQLVAGPWLSVIGEARNEH